MHRCHKSDCVYGLFAVFYHFDRWDWHRDWDLRFWQHGKEKIRGKLMNKNKLPTQDKTKIKRKPYNKPNVVFETILETQAGSPLSVDNLTLFDEE